MAQLRVAPPQPQPTISVGGPQPQQTLTVAPAAPQQTLSVAPPVAAPHLELDTSQSDYWKAYDSYKKIDLSLDPTTKSLNFSAPDYYTNSQEFKTQVLPQLSQLNGKQFTDTQFKDLINSGMLKDLQQQSDDIGKRNDAIQAYKQEFPKANDDDALLFLRNVAAGYSSKKDGDTQVVLGKNPDGSLKTASIKDYLDGFDKLNDAQKGALLKESAENVAGNKVDESQRAIQLGLVQFLKQQGALNAGGVTQVMRSMDAFLAQSDKGLVGKLSNQLTRIGNDGKTAAEVSREELANNPAYQLEGMDAAGKLGGITGTVFSLGADIVASGPLAELGGAAAVAGASKIPAAARLIDEGATAVRSLEGGGKLANFTAANIKGVPQNLAFGTEQALANPDSYNAPKDFALNTAFNAAALGAGKFIGGGINMIDTASGGKVAGASEAAGKFAARQAERFLNTPVIGSAVKKFTTGVIDQAAPLRRQLRSAWADDQIPTVGTKEKAGYEYGANAIRSGLLRGRPEANIFRSQSPEFVKSINISQDLDKLGPEELKAADDYVNASTILANAENGRYKDMSPKRLAELKTYVEENRTPLREQYRQSVADLNAKVTDFAVANGVQDKDLIEALRRDPAFANGYIRLQKSLPELEGGPRFASSERNLRGKEPIQGLKGPAAIADLENPLVVANDRLNALSQMAAVNRQHQVVVQGIQQGWIPGRILQAPENVNRRDELRRAFANEKETVRGLAEGSFKGLEGDLNKLVEDVSDFNGSGRVHIADRIQQSVDQMVEDIINDPKLNPELTRLMDEMGGGKEGSERVAALGILSRNKQQFKERLNKSLLSTDLGKEERDEVVRLFDNAINDEIDVQVADRGTSRSPLRSQFNELRKLNEEITPTSQLQGRPEVQAFFDNGQKGYYELADKDLQNYFNSRKIPEEDGWFARLLTNTSRIFKLGTTGINPTFVPVNLLRDFPQGAVMAGANVLSPTISHTALLEQLGVSAEEALQLKNEFSALISHATSFDISRQAKNVADELAAAQGKINRGPVKKVVYDLKNPKESVRNIEDLMGKTETLARGRIYQARFQNAIARGLPVAEAQQDALFYAAQATADFLNVGGKVQSFVRTVPYLTAAINGKASFARLFMLDPIGVSARFAAGIATPAIWLAAHNLANPETAAGYFNIPEYERQNNFVIMLGPDSHINIPMSQELASIVNPFRERVEAHYGLETNNFMQTLAKFVLSQGPIDLSPLETRNYAGKVDFGKAVSQIASTAVPQLFRQPIESLTGRDLYTGNQINPTDEELIASGQVDANQDITNADRTFKGANSEVLGKVANLLHVPQGTLQSTVKNYGGSVGQLVLNGLDKLVGAPSEKQGGKALQEALASRFFGGSYSQATSDFYNGLDGLEAEKEQLQTRLKKLSNESYGKSTDEAAQLMDQRQQLIDTFGQKVADFANTYGDFYKRVGGLQPFQIDSIVKVLNLGPDQGSFAEGTYQEGLINEADMESKTDAVRRATDLGVPTSNTRDRYGRLLKDEAGKVMEDYSDTTLASSNINQRIYGTPKQVAYEFAQAVSGNKKKGVQSLYDIEQGYYDKIDALYTQAKGKKGKEAQAIYDQISNLKNEYMTKEFDPRIKPLIDKYGPEVLMNNSQIFDEIGSRILVPDDLTPFASKKKQPYQKDDVQAYLLDRYGVGKLNQGNLPTDAQAQQIISQVNDDLRSGKQAAAGYKLANLQNSINTGKVYVDPTAMDHIQTLIERANHVKR